MLGERRIDFRLRELLCERGVCHRRIVEIEVFGELTNGLRAGLDRQSTGIQNNVVEKRILLFDVEIATQGACAVS
jgi:hypothetical protein